MSELVYKEIPEEDYERFAQITALAYSVPLDATRSWLRSPGVGMLRGIYRDGRLVAQAVVWTFPVQAGGAALWCGGIGSVAAPPEERRRGHVARLLREAVAELGESGAPLSLLGAFKNSYYGRYGWAPFCERRVYTGSPARMAQFRQRPRGVWSAVGAESIPEVDAVYRAALRGRFGPLERSPSWWEHHVLPRWPSGTHHLYLWRDEQRAPRAYAMFRFEDTPRGRRLLVREAAALDPQARAQIFALIANHEDQSEEFELITPADAPLQLLLADPLECRVDLHYMLRLLDVPRVLEEYPFPGDAAGRLTLAVADDWLEQNHATFALEVEGGRGRVQRLGAGSEADLSCDVRTLTPIVSRLLRPRTAAAFGMLQVSARPALALAERLFAGLAPYNTDSF